MEGSCLFHDVQQTLTLWSDKLSNFGTTLDHHLLVLLDHHLLVLLDHHLLVLLDHHLLVPGNSVRQKCTTMDRERIRHMLDHYYNNIRKA
jgi:hypothetical protein